MDRIVSNWLYEPHRILAQPMTWTQLFIPHTIATLSTNGPKDQGRIFMLDVWECLTNREYCFMCYRGRDESHSCIIVRNRDRSVTFEFAREIIHDPLLWQIEDPKLKVCGIMRVLARHVYA